MIDIRIEADVRALFEGIRDQGERPTCLAFAMSDTHSAIRADHTPLSCEFLYYKALKRSGTPPTKGTSVKSAKEALEHDGQPLESNWPYLIVSPEELLLSWPEPPNTHTVYRRVMEESGASTMIIVDALQAGAPIIAIIYLSLSFFDPGAEGFVIVKSTEQPIKTAVHAVVVVATGYLGKDRLFLIRNSWGSAWGCNGHAWIRDTDLDRLLISTALMKGAPDVSCSTATA